MARTSKEIYNDIVGAINANSSLAQLLPNPDNWNNLFTLANFRTLAATVLRNSDNSDLGLWRLISFLMTYGVYFQEQLFDIAQSQISTITENKQYGSRRWIVEQAKLFQYGDALEWLTGTNGNYYGYSIINEDKQIITQASANVLGDGTLQIKVAKGDLGSLEKLSTSEKTAFTFYMAGSDIQFAKDGILPPGIKHIIISEDPDDIKLAYTIYYDPLVLDSNGILLSDGTTKPVEDAIINFIQGLNFDSVFRIMDLTDAIQSVNGVVNVIANHVDARYGLTDYVDIMAETNQSYTAYSGYMAIAENHELNGYYDYPTNTIKSLTYIESE